MQCKERLCAGNLMLERGRREEAATRGANAFCAKSAYVRACPWVLQGFRVTARAILRYVYIFTCIHIYIHNIQMHVCVCVCARVCTHTHTHRLWLIGGNSAPGAIFRTSPLRAGKERAHTGILGSHCVCVCVCVCACVCMCVCVKYTILSDTCNILSAKKFQVP